MILIERRDPEGRGGDVRDVALHREAPARVPRERLQRVERPEPRVAAPAAEAREQDLGSRNCDLQNFVLIQPRTSPPTIKLFAKFCN